MFLVSRVNTIAPLACLTVQVLPTTESAPGKKVVLDKMKRPLHTRRTIGITNLMRLELEPKAFGKSHHFGRRNHFSARAARHNHMRVVDHDAFGRASGIAQRFGEKHFTVE